MIKNVLQEIGGIGAYGIISLCLFFGVFVGALIWALFQKPSFCKEMSGLPLQDEGIAVRSSGNGNHLHEK